MSLTARRVVCGSFNLTTLLLSLTVLLVVGGSFTLTALLVRHTSLWRRRCGFAPRAPRFALTPLTSSGMMFLHLE